MVHALAHTYDVQKREMIANTSDVRVHTLQLSAGQAVPWHKHSAVDDTFVCMTGPMVVRTDGNQPEITLHPGELFTVPAGVAHTVSPETDAGTKFLLIQATGRHDYLPISEPAR